MNWAEAFRVQAAADWCVYRSLPGGREYDHARLHQLQMTCEKLGKAILLGQGRPPVELRTHLAFVKALRVAWRSIRLREVLGLTGPALRAYIESLLPLAARLEQLAPALAGDGPNAEYPWADREGIHCPAAFDWAAIGLAAAPAGPQWTKLIALVETLVGRYEQIFG